MKIRMVRQQGSTLLVALIISALIGLSLASYLTLVSFQNKSVMRSMQWNYAVAVLEAGIEEALTHIHQNGITNLGANNWTLEGGVFVKERRVDPSQKSYFRVEITPVDPPVIFSRGYVPDPLSTSFLPPRAVRVNTKRDFLWTKGMVAKGQIDLSGNSIKTDSFDSLDPDYSTGGQYDPAKNKDNGDVATNSAVVDSLNVWNADIMGRVATGPGGTVKIGSNGAVGSKAWVAAGNNGIEPGYSNDDMNVSFPDVQEPFTSGYLTPGGGSLLGTNYNYLLASGNYELSSLSMSGSDTMLVTGNSVLYVTGDVQLSGQAKIQIAPGATLKLYVSGANTDISGNGVVNETGSAFNFAYYGLPSNTSVKFGGNADFTGAIYAPNASFTMGGGGSSTYDFVGSAIANSVRMNGHYNFHYDEALGRLGQDKGFIVTAWNEQ